MVKHLLMDISERDFRNLNLKAYRHVIENGQSFFKEIDLNDYLDKQLEYLLERGYESDFEDLKHPVTIAIHEHNNPNYNYEGYFNKFMNQFTGLQTFQFAFGIPHLYSTRDYYEAHEGDYWRVSKKETQVIYRIALDTKWINQFVLKHKNIIENYINDNEWIETTYNLGENGEWIRGHSVHITKREGCTVISPIDIERNE